MEKIIVDKEHSQCRTDTMGQAQSVQNRLNGTSTVSAEQTEWDKHSQCRTDSTGKAQSVQNGFNRKSTVRAEWIQQEKHSQCRMDSMEKVQSVQNGFNGKSSQCRMDSMEKSILCFFHWIRSALTVQSVQNRFSGKSTVRHALTSLPVTSSNWWRHLVPLLVLSPTATTKRKSDCFIPSLVHYLSLVFNISSGNITL